MTPPLKTPSRTGLSPDSPIPGAARVRNQKVTKALIATYFAGLAVAVVLFILSLTTGMSPAVFTVSYTGAILVSMAAWTLIRGANGSKDRLSDAELDEYERSIFAAWRKRAFQAFSVLNLVGGTGFCAYAYFFRDSVGAIALAAAGLYMVFTYLSVSTLPMIGFAATINRDHPEDHTENHPETHPEED